MKKLHRTQNSFSNLLLLKDITKNYTKKGNQYYKTVDLGWIKYTIPAFIMDGLVKDNLQSFFENIVKDI